MILQNRITAETYHNLWIISHLWRDSLFVPNLLFLVQHFVTLSEVVRDRIFSEHKWLNPIPIINTGLAAVSNVPVMMAATCPSSVSLSFAMNLMIILITKPTAARWVVPGEMKLSGGFKWFITSQHGSKIRQLNIEINNVKRIPKTSSKIETIKSGKDTLKFQNVKFAI